MLGSAHNFKLVESWDDPWQIKGRPGVSLRTGFKSRLADIDLVVEVQDDDKTVARVAKFRMKGYLLDAVLRLLALS